MTQIFNILLALILVTVLLSLRSNRLIDLVWQMAFQGILVSAVPLFLKTDHALSTGLILFFVLLVVVKGFVIPGLMLTAVKKVLVNREVEPLIGYVASLFAGLFMIVVSVYITEHLNLTMLAGQHLLMITGITTMGAGFVLLMARRKAITQVIGYLMMENGIYLIGTALARQVHTQYLVEFAVLLDLLVGVLVMGIVVNDINHTFDDVDTTLLGQLKD